MNFNYNDGVAIVCNSMVKNQELLEYLKPKLLSFADPVLYFSSNKYTAEFMNKMLETVEKFNCYIVIPENNMPLLLTHYPQLAPYVIGLEARNTKEYNFPTVTDFFVKGSSNILTLYMLPIASAFANEIYIIGADGRQKSDKYFWKHNSASQFNDLMEAVFETHPSFFRDRIYTDYYDEHCEFMKNLIEYGEKCGKRYYTLTPSYIPILQNRQIRL